MDKVIGGTPFGSSSLCKTCRGAHFIRGLNLQEVIYCRYVQPMVKITFPVSTCSVYDDARKPSMYQMEQIAWEVKSRNRGPCGFASDGGPVITIEPPAPQPYQPLPPVTGEKQ